MGCLTEGGRKFAIQTSELGRCIAGDSRMYNAQFGAIRTYNMLSINKPINNQPQNTQNSGRLWILIEIYRNKTRNFWIRG